MIDTCFPFSFTFSLVFRTVVLLNKVVISVCLEFTSLIASNANKAIIFNTNLMLCLLKCLNSNIMIKIK